MTALSLSAQIVRTIRVPDCRLNSRSRFDVSEDGEFLCAGNSAGAVFIYDLHEGTLISKLQSGRTKHPAHGCVFSRHCQLRAAASRLPCLGLFEC
jgi:hypothetical protein